MPDVRSGRDRYFAALAHTRTLKGFHIHLVIKPLNAVT